MTSSVTMPRSPHHGDGYGSQGFGQPAACLAFRCQVAGRCRPAGVTRGLVPSPQAGGRTTTSPALTATRRVAPVPRRKSVFSSVSSSLLWRGILAVLIGVVSVAWPGVTIGAFVVLFAAYAFVIAVGDGVRAFSSDRAGTVLDRKST